MKKLMVLAALILLSSCSGARKMSHYPDGCKPAQKEKHEMPVPTYDKTVKK